MSRSPLKSALRHDVTFIALKRERVLEVWARSAASDTPKCVVRFGIKAASGGPGPKLREHDRQVPEGAYKIADLNPNSAFHLSMRVNYPNTFDVEHARQDGRTALGGDIFIHGNAVSMGCLAMGDDVIEELFVLASRVDRVRIAVLIAPYDLRKLPSVRPTDAPAWVDELYRELATSLQPFVSPT